MAESERRPMRVIGLTGPTGAGKSAAAAVFAGMGVPVLDADRTARAVTAPGSPVLGELARAFSPEILRPDGSLDRAALAKRAFSAPEQTALLNRITHPPILRRIREELDAFARSGAALAVLDAPTLYESGADRMCSAVIAVLAPADDRLRRIMARDGLTPEQARRRIAAQPEDAFYRRRADYILENAGDLDALRSAAEAVWREIGETANEASG